MTETSDETGNPQKTGEFKGKLDGLSANGNVRLRFSGLWTGSKDGKQMPFSLRQLGFDLCGLKLDEGVGKFAKATAKRLCSDRQAYIIDDEIIAANKDFISTLSHSDHLGSLHPYTTTKSSNYDLNRNTTVRLADLFNPYSNYLKVISDYSIRELEKLETDDIYGEIERGAGPKLENFHSWNITHAGLKITFDPYRVGACVDGEYEVVVPYSVLKPIIKPDGLLAQFVR